MRILCTLLTLLLAPLTAAITPSVAHAAGYYSFDLARPGYHFSYGYSGTYRRYPRHGWSGHYRPKYYGYGGRFGGYRRYHGKDYYRNRGIFYGHRGYGFRPYTFHPRPPGYHRHKGISRFKGHSGSVRGYFRY